MNKIRMNERKILFRGRGYDGRWRYGLTVFTRNNINPETITQYIGLNDATEWNDLTEYEKSDFLGHAWGRTPKDWAGRKIFQGDILKTEIGCLTVSYCNKLASFCLDREGWIFKFGESIDAEDCKIIGNIFETRNF